MLLRENPEVTGQNPLLDFSGLPQFERIKPEHVAPAIEQLLADGRATTAASLSAKRHLGRFRRAARGCERAPGPRLGPGRAPERGDEQPGAARGLQREPAEDHAVLHRARRRTRGCSRSSRRCAIRPSFARSAPAQKKIIENELRDFRLGGAELPADKKGALHGDPRAALAAVVALQRQPARCDECVRRIVDGQCARSAGIPDDVLQAARETRRRRTARPAGSSRCTRRPTCR